MKAEVENALYDIEIIKGIACQYGTLCTLEKTPLGGSVVSYFFLNHTLKNNQVIWLVVRGKKKKKKIVRLLKSIRDIVNIIAGKCFILWPGKWNLTILFHPIDTWGYLDRECTMVIFAPPKKKIFAKEVNGINSTQKGMLPEL